MIRSALTVSVFIFIVSTTWLAFEKLIGLHGKLIHYHSVITLILPIIIILITAKSTQLYRFKQGGKITFTHALFFGLTLTAFNCALAPATLWIFETFINPNFYKDFIKYSIDHGLHDKVTAFDYFNHDNYLRESLLGQAAMGTILSIILAFSSSRR
jgi:Na+-transporting methylmalonyl-CoA/oxaloacetate decarboxylase beta subunit